MFFIHHIFTNDNKIKFSKISNLNIYHIFFFLTGAQSRAPLTIQHLTPIKSFFRPPLTWTLNKFVEIKWNKKEIRRFVTNIRNQNLIYEELMIILISRFNSRHLLKTLQNFLRITPKGNCENISPYICKNNLAMFL